MRRHLFIFVLFFIGVFFLFPATRTEAATVGGYAWSDNIGWISLSCADAGICASSNYGVTIDTSTGNLAGYAWSDNIGWISFNAADVAGCPAGTCQPKFNVPTGQNTGPATGWAKAIGASQGWDGWISLNCSNTGACGTSNYSVVYGPGSITGYAWGSDVIGWVSFSGSTYGVTTNATFNSAPSSPTFATVPPGQTIGNPDNPVTFSLNATDPNNDQIRYGIDWNMDGTADDWMPVGVSYVNSGTTLTIDNTWTTAGLKTFQALAQDSPGLNSAWTQKSITITPQCSDGADNDGDGYADSTDPGCHTDSNYSNVASYDPAINAEASGLASSCNNHVDDNADVLTDCADPVCHLNNSLLQSCDVSRGEGAFSFTALLGVERGGRNVTNKIIPPGATFDITWVTTGSPTGCDLRNQRTNISILPSNLINKAETILTNRYSVSGGNKENTTYVFTCSVNSTIKARLNVKVGNPRSF